MVIRFFSGKSAADWPEQGLNAEVEAYWEALRQNDALPQRALLDPRGIIGALEHVFLIERIGTGIARFRIAGMALHDLLGIDLRGLPVSALFLGEARLRLQVELERMFHAPAKLTLSLKAPGALGRADLMGRALLLPMTGREGQRDLALGCLELSGQTGSASRRFLIEDARFQRLEIPTRMQTEVAPPLPVRAREVPAPTPASAQGRPHLRLVHSVP